MLRSCSYCGRIHDTKDICAEKRIAHFECDDAKELCEKLFGNEVNDLSDEISKLSGVISDEDSEEEVKN